MMTMMVMMTLQAADDAAPVHVATPTVITECKSAYLHSEETRTQSTLAPQGELPACQRS